MKKDFKFIDHTADIKFIARGKGLEEAFENSALATLKAIYSGNKKVENKIEKDIKLKGKDLKNLVYNFLEEIIFLIDSDQFLTGNIEGMKITKSKTGDYILKCKLFGDKSQNYSELDHIKSVTYSEMIVEEDKNKNWTIQVVLDV